ncbi:hypothetical protein KQX54_015510 [Cotesia glomerata]|uniref:THAP-type domain-containing protein n=1 Tax=Cotesia glomerata TaxID=32391 RepID=A0AAV7I2V0_COTGL|nr:hypothetical protein KQX54_015510 [Cotesia glomerata]
MEVIKLTPRKKNKSRVYCAVNGCGSKSHENLEISFHAIPKPGSSFVYIENLFGKKEKIDRFKDWQRDLKLKNINPHMRVCSLHFERNDFVLPDIISKKMTLKKTSVPSCNLMDRKVSIDVEKNKEARHHRQVNRSLKKIAVEKNKNISENCSLVNIENIVTDKSEEMCFINDNVVEMPLNKSYNDIGVQVETLFINPSFMDFIKTEDDFRTATGIQSYQMLETIVEL